MCDRTVVVVSPENKEWFNDYDTIIINSGLGCGDAVMKALEVLNPNNDDECFIVWGDCICQCIGTLSIFGSNSERVLIPCVWEKSPYVSIESFEDGSIKVLFSKYGEVSEPGFHDLGVFYGNAQLILTKLKEFAKKIEKKGWYVHKHGNEMQFLDVFNETDIKGSIMPVNRKAISFNTIEELNSL
jgi:hypothetical protein